MYYKGYHTLSEGKIVFDLIKLHINKYRLSINSNLLKTSQISISKIENLLKELYLKDSPYVIKESVRYYRNTNKLVSDAPSVTVIDSNKKKTSYNSISECAKNLNISRTVIKNCLDSGKLYKGYSFVLN
jgi:hypothetical protein